MTKPLKKIITRADEWHKIDQQVRSFMRQWPDKHFYIHITSDYQLRSLSQNNYYWGILIPTIQNFLLENEKELAQPKKIHKDLKNAFARGKIFIVDEDKHKVQRSTAHATTKEFTEYLECIWAWYAREGLLIPKPNEIITVDDRLLF